MANKNISKSRFIAGLQCEKRLWLEIHRRELAGETDEQTLFIFDRGHIIGEMVQTLFPEGVLISEDHLHMAQSIEATQRAVQKGESVIFEAGAKFGRFVARADILKRVEDGGEEWDIMEVKSGSDEEKEVYLNDLAIQTLIFEGAGYKIRKACLVTINTDYVRDGPIDVKKLFIITDQTKTVRNIYKNFPAIMEKFLTVVDSEQEPKVAISNQRCYKPYTCSFADYCWKGVPEDSVFTLAYDRKKLAPNLYSKGIVKIADIPEDLPLSIKQIRQIQAAKTGKPYWNLKGVESFLNSLEYPLYFLDFETYCPLIPPYDGIRPYRNIPFQFSMHHLEKPGGELKQFEFLSDGKEDPRPIFMEALLKDIGKNGSIVVYSGYEAQRLNDMAGWFPQYAPAIRAINKRMRDLLVPFRNRDVVYPGFLGSASIKAVLPVLVPGMGYDSLEIGEGGAASLAYEKLLDPKVPKAEKDKIRKDLLVYCGQDTLAMVKLVEVLKEKVSI